MELPSPPAALQTDDEAGVRAVTQYVLDLYVYMYRTGDTAPFAAISSDVCTFCSASVKDATALWDGGGYMTGGALTMSADATISVIGDTGVFQVQGDLTRDAAKRVRGDGTVVDEPAQVVGGAKAGVGIVDGVWTFIELENPAKK